MLVATRQQFASYNNSKIFGNKKNNYSSMYSVRQKDNSMYKYPK